ncbi:MAG: 1-deoxy-D-xylulose-5-phosphate reductoisomerase [Planctomycetes bacterium]|nr:1-deoxy-D-xylulose-5-phosphate reductoisomerase [Planctomycetota bacterium]
MKLAILGSTGEIGTRALKVSESLKECEILAIICNKNWKLFAEQITKYNPRYAIIRDSSSYKKLRNQMHLNGTKLLNNADDILEISDKHKIDTIIGATIGTTFLRLNYELIKLCKRFLIANKESIVLAGRLFMKKAARHGTQIVPLDSEHFGLFSLINAHGTDFSRIYLTASGGPFRTYSRNQLKNVTPKQALNHPIWKMGARITIDSATLMNKAFEVIEASYLFNVPGDKIKVVIHPESIIHAMIEYPNGAFFAQMSLPRMEIPIKQAMINGNRNRNISPKYRMDFHQIKQLTFDEVNGWTPAVKFGIDALKKGGSFPIALNAADEVAVESFLQKKIPFLKITEIIEKILNNHKPVEPKTISDILDVDSNVRKETSELVKHN